MGDPAKKIESFYELMEKRRKESALITETSRGKRIESEWKKFYLQREGK